MHFEVHSISGISKISEHISPVIIYPAFVIMALNIQEEFFISKMHAYQIQQLRGTQTVRLKAIELIAFRELFIFKWAF